MSKAENLILYGKIALVILIFTFTSELPRIGLYCFRSTKNFIAANCDYEKIRHTDSMVASVRELAKTLPYDAKVEMSPLIWKKDRVKARYAIYPIQIIAFHSERQSRDSWDYFIDLEGTFQGPKKFLKNHQLSTGVNVFLKPGSKLISQGSSVTASSILKAVKAFLLITIASLVSGLGLLALLRISTKATGLFWYFGSGYNLGFLVVTGVTWLFLIVGMRFDSTNIFLIVLTTPAFMVLLNTKLLVRKGKEILETRWTLTKLRWDVNSLLLSLPPLLVITTIVLATSLTPVHSWDAMSHWIMKSKVIFHEKGLIFNFTHHNQYPILWPLNIAIQFSLSGGYYDELAKWTAAILLVSFVCQLIGCFRLLRMRNTWIWFFLVVYFACFFHTSMTWAYAENAFLAFFTGALSWVLWWIEDSHKKNYVIVGVLMAIGMALVKFEGGAASVILGISLVLLFNNRVVSSRAWLPVTFLFLVPILPIGWLLWNKSAGFLPQISHMDAGLTFQKILIVIKQNLFIASRSHIGRGLFFGMLFFALLKHSKSLTKTETFLLLTSMGMVSFSAFGIIGWDIDMIQSTAKNAIPRLFLHSTPALIVLLVSLLMNSQKYRDVKLSDQE